jgi:hypothetical protein
MGVEGPGVHPREGVSVLGLGLFRGFGLVSR